VGERILVEEMDASFNVSFKGDNNLIFYKRPIRGEA
jgi:hypothetical protein